MSKIRAYYSTRVVAKDLLESDYFKNIYLSTDPNFWVSSYFSASYALLLVNGDDRDHTKITNQAGIKTADFNDIRSGIDDPKDSTIISKAVNHLPNLNLSDFDNAVNVRDVLTVIIQHLEPGQCALSFDNAPNPTGTFTDDCVDTDAVLLQNHTPSGGTAWTLETDGGYTAPIYSNAISFKVGGGGTGFSAWICDDQGSAKQYVQAYDGDLTAKPAIYLAVRYYDIDNFIAYHLPGAGGVGARLCKVVAGVETDLAPQTQGAEGYGFKVECGVDGDDTAIRLSRDIVGDETWSQIGSDVTVDESVINTATRSGCVVGVHSGDVRKFYDFENGLVGSGGASASLTGTAITGGVTETEIVTGGDTIIITLTGDTWVATVGDDNAITDALIDGITSAQSEAAGWNAVVKANMVFGDVTRTSDTVVTIILAAEATYEITANETITVTIPATALTAASEVVATPTFDVTNEGAVLLTNYYYQLLLAGEAA